MVDRLTLIGAHGYGAMVLAGFYITCHFGGNEGIMKILLLTILLWGDNVGRALANSGSVGHVCRPIVG